MAVVGLVVVVAWPLAELVLAAAERGVAGVRAAFATADAGTAAWNTVWIALVVTPAALVLGTAAAVTTERLPVRGPQALRAGMLLGLVVPPFVTAQSWARAYGPSGLVDDLVGWSLPGVYGALGVVLVQVVEAVPLAWLVVAAGLASRAEPDLERAARASGASSLVAFRTVTLPLLRPALVASGALVFVVTINAFGAPAILGIPGNVVTMTTRIYRDLTLSADPAAFNRVVVLATTLVALAAVVVAATDVRGRVHRTVLRTGVPTGPVAATGTSATAAAVAVWAWVAVTIGLPTVALVLTALTRGVGVVPVPANWTLHNFRAALAGPTLGAVRNSLVLAVAAATVVLALGALVVALRRTRTGRAVGTGAVLTFAVPGSTLAVAVLLAHGSWLRDTLALILVAYVAKFWALGHRVLAGAADTLPREVGWAARASGASPSVALRTVTVPALAPAIAAAWLLVLLTGLHELTMSSLLYGPGTRTLAVAILDAEQLGDVTVTSAMAVLLTLALVVVATVPWLVRRPGRRRS